MCDCIVCTSVLGFLITKIKFANYKSYIVFNDNPITKLAKSRYERELISHRGCLMHINSTGFVYTKSWQILLCRMVRYLRVFYLFNNIPSRIV